MLTVEEEVEEVHLMPNEIVLKLFAWRKKSKIKIL